MEFTVMTLEIDMHFLVRAIGTRKCRPPLPDLGFLCLVLHLPTGLARCWAVGGLPPIYPGIGHTMCFGYGKILYAAPAWLRRC